MAPTLLSFCTATCMLTTVAAFERRLAFDAPADWQPLIASGNMKFSADLPQPLGGLSPGLYPAVGNGFIAVEAGPFLQMWVNNWPWRSSGSVHMAGVFNGVNYTTPSHRAQLPSVSHFAVAPETGGTYSMLGSAIDYRIATFYNRTLIDTPSCSNTILEQRLYAHRVNRSVLILELAAWSAGDGHWAGCSVSVDWDIDATYTPDAALTRVDGNDSYPSYWDGSTLLAEEAGLPLREIGIAFDAWVATAAATGRVTFPPAPGANSSSTASVMYVTAVYHSDLDAGSGGALAAAVDDWRTLQAQSSIAALRASHAAAWAQLWSSGIELMGNGSLAATVNGSLYDIIISMRDDWPYSTSPGGLMAGGYCGHSFWDGETWIFPNLVVFFPSIAHGMTVYRNQRLGASMQRAANYGYDGAFWAWESAFTGLDASPWRQADISEHHISGDIPMAMRKYYSATGDKAWLSSVAWPVLNATCAFWECRLTRTDSTGGAPPGYGPACSAKDGVGNWTALNVIPPDEAAGVVNNSVYTNAIAASTLQWCVDASAILGVSVPALWAEMASAPYLSLNNTLDPSGAVHNEYTNWDGHAVNQADVALLQYPLGLSFPPDLALRDLDYWTNHTNWGSFFTGDSAYSVSYLGLGNRLAADAQFALAFQHMESHFNVWEEVTSGGGTQHFITGAGGYLQSFTFGYSGMRINRVGVLSFTSQQPLLPPLGITAAKLRGLNLLGTLFDFAYNASTICVALQSAGGTPLELRTPIGGQPLRITTTPVCVGVQPVEVAGVGFP